MSPSSSQNLLRLTAQYWKFHCTLSFIMESWHNLSPRAAETSSIPISLALYRTPSPLNLFIKVASLRSWPAKTTRTRGVYRSVKGNKQTQPRGKAGLTPTPDTRKHFGGIRRRCSFSETFWPRYLKGIRSGSAATRNLLHGICTQIRFTEVGDKPESQLVDLNELWSVRVVLIPMHRRILRFADKTLTATCYCFLTKSLIQAIFTLLTFERWKSKLYSSRILLLYNSWLYAFCT